MSKTRRIEFLERLANLLQEYNAEIEIECDEDSVLDGLSLVVSFYDEKVFEDCSLWFNSDKLKLYIKQIKDA